VQGPILTVSEWPILKELLLPGSGAMLVVAVEYNTVGTCTSTPIGIDIQNLYMQIRRQPFDLEKVKVWCNKERNDE